jgi:GrpB-like predicted nucleotidyltransferase (UPF0157 family)
MSTTHSSDDSASADRHEHHLPCQVAHGDEPPASSGMQQGRSPLWNVEQIGGPEPRQIVIVDYDPAWPEQFENHRKRIADALGAKARRIEHVGSTSVPGLAAKPIIDIQVSVTNPEHETAYVPALEHAGYRLRVREPGHRMLRTPQFDVHVHVCGAGSEWEQRHLVFRDWLRRNEADRSLYETTKRLLARRTWPTVDHYADAKTAVIADIMGRASTESGHPFASS